MSRKNKPGAGRPRVLSQQRIQVLLHCYLVRRFNLEAACHEAGISRSTWHRHVRREVAAARAACEVAP